MWKLIGQTVEWVGEGRPLTASTINHEVDLSSIPPAATARLRLTEGDRPLYADRAAWVGLDLPHQLYGSFAIAITPFGRALVRLDSRRCGMTFEFLRLCREGDAIGDDVSGTPTGEKRFY